MSFATALARLRLELADQGAPFQAEVIGDNQTSRFNLPVVLVSSTGLTVLQGQSPNYTTLTSPTQYTMDYREGVILLTTPPPAGHSLIVRGTHYRAFLDSDLTTLLNAAISQHNHERSPLIYFDPVSPQVGISAVEEFAVVLLAKIDALWSLITDAAQEIDVISPDGVNIPESQRYRQLLEMLRETEERYASVSQSLNVGIHRIRVYTAAVSVERPAV